MTLIAAAILTAIDVARELGQNRDGASHHRVLQAEASLNDFREALITAIRTGQDVTPEEIWFWDDRISQDREELRALAKDPEDTSEPDLL